MRPNPNKRFVQVVEVREARRQLEGHLQTAGRIEIYEFEKPDDGSTCE